MKKHGTHGHTREHRGARVLVTMCDGSQFVDVFIERPKHRRWITLKGKGRVAMGEVKCVSRCPATLKGRK